MRIQMLYELQVAAGYPEEDARRERSRHSTCSWRNAARSSSMRKPWACGTLGEHYTLGALTNGNADIYKTDAAEYFDFAFLAEDIGAAKPHPDMFHAALREAGVAAADIVTWVTTRSTMCGARARWACTRWVNIRHKPWPGR